MTFDKKLKIAVIGCGKMGKQHLRAIQIQNCAEIVAVADPFVNKEQLASLVSDKVRLYSRADDLFKNSPVDVVHITTPPSTHSELAKMALENGASVYVEKPFALNSSDAESILSIADKRKLKVCAGHQVLFEKAARGVEEYIDQIGRIVHIESYFSFRGVRRNITKVEQMIDILPHPVYLLLHIFQRDLHGQQGDVEICSIEVQPEGEVRSILKIGDLSGVLIITLRGRPIESYLRIIGTSGSLYADFVRGTVAKHIGPGASAISVVLAPYSQARQLLFKTTRSFAGLALKKQKSYPGLAELIGEFYQSIVDKKPTPVSCDSIINTVKICETISEKLIAAEAVAENEAALRLKQRENEMPPVRTDRGIALVTGGTGFLGKVVSEELRNSGWPVRVISRRIPGASARAPGIEYVTGDISNDLPKEYFKDVSVIVHLAAETAGTKEDHDRNTVQATRKMMEAAGRFNIMKFINMSSIAVLKPGRAPNKSLNEDSPVDYNIERGPYVWAKASAERIVEDLGQEHGIEYRTVRLGPLVDFKNYTPPGRLGRELGPLYIAVGSPQNRMSLCDVKTAAHVIRFMAENFEKSPQTINLVEPDAPTRKQLVQRLRKERPDLTILWMPFAVIKAMSWLLKSVLKLLRPGKKAIDVYAAFSSERYDSTLAEKIIHNSMAVNEEVING